MRLSIGSKILIGITLALIVSLAVNVVLYVSVNHILSNRQLVRRSMELLDQLDDLLESLIEIENGQRLYILTGKEASLDLAKTASRRVPVQLDDIQKSIPASPPEQERMASLRSAVRSAMTYLSQSVEVRRTAGFDLAQEVVMGGIGRESMDKVRSTLTHMRTDTLQQLKVRDTADKHSVQRMLTTTIVAFFVQFVLLGLLYWLTRLDDAQRLRAEADLVRTGTDLAAARDSALAAAKMKSQFLANMSHEIRTPMNGVLGMAEILLNTQLTSRQREFAETIQSSANALLTIINDILDFSKIETGMLRFENMSFNLHKTIESVIDLFAQTARKKNLELALLIEEGVPVFVVGDPFRLRQILANFISNALKFTDKGEVILRCQNMQDTPGKVRLRFNISDTGIGVAPEDIEKLFMPFVQADASETRRFGGTGLGLAISKQLVTGMGGETGVESTLGERSTFWFTAKFGISSDQAPLLTSEGDLRNVRVLLVDDNATNRKILHYQVGSWGMRDSVASSGPHALTILRQAAAEGDPFAVVILDMHMPELEGGQMVELIQSDASISGVKLVLLTSVESADCDESARRGVDAFITKPVKQSHLFETLCKVLGLSAATLEEPKLKLELDSERVAIRSLRVLLAEDNEVNQRVALYHLRMLGHHADLAPNGLAALTLLEKNRYDAALIDINMPELDGLATAAEIRRREAGRKHTWIIAMTANALPEDREKCLAAGMDDYLAKPVQASMLVRALERCPVSQETPSRAINLDSLFASGLADILPELIKTFLQITPGMIENASSALHALNAEELGRVVHSIRGSCGSLGAERLGELCQQIENLARSGSLETAPDLLAAVEKEYSRVRAELHATLEESNIGADKS